MVRSVTNRRVAIRLRALGDQCQHLALAFVSLSRVGPASAGEEPGDDRRVDDCLAVREAGGGRR
jgi:hypothetical protein